MKNLMLLVTLSLIVISCNSIEVVEPTSPPLKEPYYKYTGNETTIEYQSTWDATENFNKEWLTLTDDEKSKLKKQYGEYLRKEAHTQSFTSSYEKANICFTLSIFPHYYNGMWWHLNVYDVETNESVFNYSGNMYTVMDFEIPITKGEYYIKVKFADRGSSIIIGTSDKFILIKETN